MNKRTQAEANSQTQVCASELTNHCSILLTCKYRLGSDFAKGRVGKAIHRTVTDILQTREKCIHRAIEIQTDTNARWLTGRIDRLITIGGWGHSVSVGV